MMRPHHLRQVLSFGLGCLPLLSFGATETGTSLNLDAMRSALIPKREVAADAFIAQNPTFDGRGVTVAIFDTGVDPAAAGLSVTTTGERKVWDILDASGSGDVDTSQVQQVKEDGTLVGLSGKALTLPSSINNPSGDFHLGLKPAKELFPSQVWQRLEDHLTAEWEAEVSRSRAQQERSNHGELTKALATAPTDRSRSQRDLVARADLRQKLENDFIKSGPGPLYDCVVWHDGTHWRVIVDTNRNGDLADEKQLRPFGVAGEFATFDSSTNASFGVQVYEEGNLLSIVTVSGTHGTHVASIATAHFPSDPSRNGIAPGARVLSIKIGDVRTGGSSYGISERRALALAATYGVDIVNASWGGGSVYQDGADSNAKIYRTLVERYDILAVLSAGNLGPALSTAGSAGGEASRILGVGAYASTEMGQALYQSIEASPDAALQFTSRGPTKDGAIGVDIMAPGAAWASYSAESLTGTEMINGTSMASPSAAGVAALVLSAAKQAGLKAEPARLRQALILGATPIDAEAVFTTGQGLINAVGAWDKLQALQTIPEFRGFYDLSVTGGTFTSAGRGLYLREAFDDLRRRVVATVTPAWPESVTSEEQFRFETDLEFLPADDWIAAPNYTHLANGDQRVTLVLDIPALTEAERHTGGLLTSRVDAFIAGNRAIGPLFSIPVTVVRPADETLFVKQQRKTSVALAPAKTERLFLAVPERAERLKLKMKHVAEDPIARRFFVQALTPTAHTSQGQYKQEAVGWLDEGEEMQMNIPVKGGGVTEIAFNQYFYSFGDSTLELEMEWVGVGLPPSKVALEPNQDWVPLTLDPLSTAEVAVDAKLEHGMHVYLPKTTQEVYDGARSAMPASPRTPGPAQSAMLRLSYEIDLDEPLKAAISDLQDFDTSEVLGGGRVTVLHESGELLYDGFGSLKKPISFPKGKSTVIRDYSSQFPGTLAPAKRFALVLAAPLKPTKSIPISADLRAAFQGKDASKLNLTEGREQVIYLRDTAIDDLVKVTPMPDYFTGSIEFKGKDEAPISQQPLIYYPGKSPAKVTDQDATAKPAKDLRAEPEKLEDAWYDLQLKFVRDNRAKSDQAIKLRRQAALASVLAARPDDPATLLEQSIDAALAAGFASEFWGKVSDEKKADAAEDNSTSEGEANATEEPAVVVAESEPPLTAAEIFAILDRAHAAANPAEVAAFFGAKPVALPGDLARRHEIAAETKRFDAQRKVLAQIALLRADVARGTGAEADAWAAFAEVARWEEKPAEETAKLEAILRAEAKLAGLALESLNTQLEKKPFDQALLRQRIQLYRDLGWEAFAQQQEEASALRDYQKRRLTPR